MKSILLIYLVSVLASVNVFAQTQADASKYSALTLADSLKKNANAVYRLDEGIVDVISASKYSFKVHNIVTLLNKEAEGHLSHTLHFDKFEKVEDVEIKVFNAAGLLVKKYTKKDFETRSYDDRISLYTDDKLLHLETAAPGYPCTIETIYELKTTGYIELPDWMIASPGEAVETSIFTVKVPAALDIRHLTSGIELKPSIKTVGETKIYTWLANNITADKSEPDSYESSSYYPRIQVSPQAFDYDGYKGEMKTWKSYGAWNYQFYEDNKPFNKTQSADILNAVAVCKTDKEKVNILYDRLKKTMRYVSIQLGIGGFKPFAVQFVNEKQYGDCKALTNYMRYMLKAAGIRSYPALINAGYNKAPANPEFPAQIFNHVLHITMHSGIKPCF